MSIDSIKEISAFEHKSIDTFINKLLNRLAMNITCSSSKVASSDIIFNKSLHIKTNSP